MFKRYTSASLALVLLFIYPETFSQSNNVCAKDDLASEFALGQFEVSSITISSKTNGEISLRSLAPDEDFNDGNIPSGWNGSAWNTGGTTTYSEGIATLNGSRIYTDKTYLPGTSIEFSARFTLGNFENIGFAKNGDFDLYWLVIGRGGIGSDPNVYVRSSDGVSVPIGANLLNEYHNYRITWGEDNFTIYVDEIRAATVEKTYTTDLTFLISDFNNDASFLSVEWIKFGMSSHVQLGNYQSRAIPLSNSTVSFRVNWNAILPENTEMEIFVRSGSTPVPDNSWSPLTEVVSNNQLINSYNNSYVQYILQFSSIGTFTPVFNDISFTCSDELVPPIVIPPPVISNITILPNKDGSAEIRWTTDRPSDSRIDYGTSPESLTFSKTSDGFLSIEHFLSIAGLTQGTTYYARVSSTDAQFRTSISPLAPDDPLSFTVPVYTPVCAKDDIVSDFEDASIKGNTEAVNIINGELSLKHISAEEQFNSISIPEGWNAGSWTAGATTNFSGGIATLNGTRIYSTESFQPGVSFEFYARFTLGNYQNIGLAKNGSFDPFWLVIGRGGIASDPNLYVRSSEGVNISLGNNLLDNYHQYRIDWESDRFLVYVDGILRTTVTKTYSSQLLLMVSDHDFDGTALSLDWIRYTKKIYPNTGVYLSKVFSLGVGPAAVTVDWNSTLPSNTAVTISVRSSSYGGSWSSFVPVTNHQSISLGKSYLQYQAVLSTTNTKVTPLLNEISFNCGNVEPVDITPPVISFANAGFINEGRAIIGWVTDELASGQIEYGTDPGNLNQVPPESESLEFPSVTHSTFISGLIEGTTYYYRVSSKDAAHNSASFPIVSEPPLQFTYPFASIVCASEDSRDFGAGGTGTNTEIVFGGIFTPEGSVKLKKTDNLVTENFNSTSIPAGWNAGTWNPGGTTNFSGGIATLNGTRIYSSEKFLPGSTITFSAKFSLGNYENIGFAQNGNFDPYWIVIGRGQLGADPNLYIRTSEGVNISLGSNLLDAYHSYRISWNNTNFTIEVDNITTTVMKTFTSPMLIQISDYNNDATSLSVDWIKSGLHNYPASGTFVSRVFSLGSTPDFATVSWNRNAPVIDPSGKTAMFISVRSGNTATPDGSWTEFQQVTQNQLFKPIGSYLQYKAVLISNDRQYTPALFDISFTCSGSQSGNTRSYMAGADQKPALLTNQTFRLEQNHPNPFNNNTIITYTVPKSVRVLLTIYDLQGRVVKIAEDVHRSPGKYNVNVDTRKMGKGIYIYRLQAGEFSATKKMIVE